MSQACATKACRVAFVSKMGKALDGPDCLDQKVHKPSRFDPLYSYVSSSLVLVKEALADGREDLRQNSWDRKKAARENTTKSGCQSSSEQAG